MVPRGDKWYTMFQPNDGRFYRGSRKTSRRHAECELASSENYRGFLITVIDERAADFARGTQRACAWRKSTHTPEGNRRENDVKLYRLGLNNEI